MTFLFRFFLMLNLIESSTIIQTIQVPKILANIDSYTWSWARLNFLKCFEWFPLDNSDIFLIILLPSILFLFHWDSITTANCSSILLWPKTKWFLSGWSKMNMEEGKLVLLHLFPKTLKFVHSSGLYDCPSLSLCQRVFHWFCISYKSLELFRYLLNM